MEVFVEEHNGTGVVIKASAEIRLIISISVSHLICSRRLTSVDDDIMTTYTDLTACQ